MGSPFSDGLPPQARRRAQFILDNVLPAHFTGLCEGAHGPSNKALDADGVGALIVDPGRAGGLRVWCEECASA